MIDKLERLSLSDDELDPYPNWWFIRSPSRALSVFYPYLGVILTSSFVDTSPSDDSFCLSITFEI